MNPKITAKTLSEYKLKLGTKANMDRTRAANRLNFINLFILFIVILLVQETFYLNRTKNNL